jgi:mannose-1-phosphate guanylyltransferase
MYLGSDHRHHWGVILAGGEGVRLKSLTRFVSGEDTPKQFCPLLGGKTLLAQTKQRIARGISPERTVYVLLSAHERFYSKELRSVPPSHMITQPCNRGTLPAIICSLINIVRRDPEAVVGFFPSDHHYTDEDKFMAGVGLAFAAAEGNPQRVILLGVAARHAETDYGWIEAEPALSTATSNGILKVKRFWEKPSPRTADDLLERGCVWNTFVMIGRAQAFLDMIQTSAPEILREFAGLVEGDPGNSDSAALEAVYEELTTTDFSSSVLSSNPEKLGVWCLGDVGWSDLGDPRRVVSMLSETGVTNEWMTLWQERSAVVAAGN